MTGKIPDFYGADPVSRAWRREQMEISNDFEGIPRDRHLDALNAALDALDLTDEQRITALTAYFRSLAVAPPSPAIQDWMDRFGALWLEGAPAPYYSQKPQKGP